jgi:hypothetical protein
MPLERVVTGVLAVLLAKAVLYDFPMYLSPTSFKKYLKYVLGSIYLFALIFSVSYFYNLPGEFSLYLVCFIVVIIPGVLTYFR